MKKDKTYIIKRDVKIALVGLICTSLFVFITNPFKLPIFMIIFVPIMIGLISLFSIRLFIEVFFDVSQRVKTLVSNSVAISLIIVIMLGSLKQLTPQDLTLVLSIVSGITFYIYKSNPKSISFSEAE